LIIDYAKAAYKDKYTKHTKHDKSSETYTDNIKKTLKTYTADAAASAANKIANTGYVLNLVPRLST